MGFNVLTGKPGRSEMGSVYRSLAVTDNNGECTLASDYIFVNGESYVPLSIKIETARKQRQQPHHKDIDVPYRRGHLTARRAGAFLTNRYDTGIGIGPIFDDFDDINIDLDGPLQ